MFLDGNVTIVPNMKIPFIAVIAILIQKIFIKVTK
jgi:hypothetical protein